MRGGTGAGKTTYLKELFKDALDDKGELSGCVNPDYIKSVLKGHYKLTNFQVHEEAVRGPLSKFKQEILKTNYSLIFDTRLTSLQDLKEIVRQAKTREIQVYDLDTSFPICMQRVLATRTSWSISPCVDAETIQAGFQDIRRCRRSIIDYCMRKQLIGYTLVLADQSDYQIVAKKTGKNLQIVSDSILDRYLKAPSVSEMLCQMEEVTTIQPWQGFPIGKALNYQASGIELSSTLVEMEKEAEWRSQYGTIKEEPLSDSWLSDYPNIYQHLLE